MALTHYEWVCSYDDGSEVRGLEECPLVKDGSGLINSEVFLVEDVESRKIPWWLLLVVLYVAWDQRRK